jgi:hypothetical protein
VNTAGPVTGTKLTQRDLSVGVETVKLTRRTDRSFPS